MRSFIPVVLVAAATAVSAIPIVSPAPTYSYNAGFNMGAQKVS